MDLAWLIESRTDITLLTFDALREKTKTLRPGDGQEYFKYLCMLLPNATRCRSTPEELNSRYPGGEDIFVKKVFHLIDLLDTKDTQYYFFQALIRITAGVFRRECGRVVAGCKFAADRANQRVFQIIRERFEPSASTPFCDYAAAFRKLRSAWTIQCDTKFAKDGKSEHSTCWHKQNRALLELVQKRAHDEFRATIMLTVGAQLPVELTKTIHDLAIELEDILQGDILSETEVIKLVDRPWAIQTKTVTSLLWRHCACERDWVRKTLDFEPVDV